MRPHGITALLKLLLRADKKLLFLGVAIVLVLCAGAYRMVSDHAGVNAKRARNSSTAASQSANKTGSATATASSKNKTNTPTVAKNNAKTTSTTGAAKTGGGSAAANGSAGQKQQTVSSSPPPSSGYFTSTQAPGSWTSLPSDSQCDARVHASTWEPRPQNSQQNNTMPPATAMKAAFAIRTRDNGNTYNPLWDSWLLPRVDGQHTGTTDEIIQWASCKWGLPDNLLRAEAAVESTWFQYLHFPDDASFGGGGGSCYWNRGCGDAFPAATSASTTYCQGIAVMGILSSEEHDYQSDPITAHGGYPYTPATGLCPKTYSIIGVMSWEDPAWESPYPPYQGNQNGTFPYTRDSTAAALDYYGASIRGCYEGWETWLKNTGTKNYAAGDLWGCVGSWYSGDWHSSAANTYISTVQTNENNLIWLQSAFDDASQQFHCDPTYGCPN